MGWPGNGDCLWSNCWVTSEAGLRVVKYNLDKYCVAFPRHVHHPGNLCVAEPRLGEKEARGVLTDSKCRLEVRELGPNQLSSKAPARQTRQLASRSILSKQTIQVIQVQTEEPGPAASELVVYLVFP